MKKYWSCFLMVTLTIVSILSIVLKGNTNALEIQAGLLFIIALLAMHIAGKTTLTIVVFLALGALFIANDLMHWVTTIDGVGAFAITVASLGALWQTTLKLHRGRETL